jgi:radical SAM protein with 4Fe4S-binding SPASM domain
MCPHSKIQRDEGFMDLDLFKKLVDDISSYNPDAYIQLYYVGESLLHPKILQMVKYLKQNNLTVYIATNATLLDEEMALGLIDAKLDYISFSFDAPDKETYESIRIGASYEKVLENINRFLRLKEELESNIQVKVEIIAMEKTKNKISTFVNKFKRLHVDEINIKPFIGWAGIIDYSVAMKKYTETNCICNRPWRMLAITWDGLYLPCCEDFEAKYVVGDAHNDSIADVWNNKRMQYLREKLRLGEYNKVDLCRNCKDVEVLSERFTFPEVGVSDKL